jgi:hypothetical protein
VQIVWSTGLSRYGHGFTFKTIFNAPAQKTVQNCELSDMCRTPGNALIPERCSKFSQSFSDRFMRQDNVHLHFLHIQFHENNYLGVFPTFALAGKHGNSPLHFAKKASTIQTCVLTSLSNIDHLQEVRKSLNQAPEESRAADVGGGDRTQEALPNSHSIRETSGMEPIYKNAPRQLSTLPSLLRIARIDGVFTGFQCMFGWDLGRRRRNWRASCDRKGFWTPAS